MFNECILTKTGNEYSTEIICERFVRGRARKISISGMMIQEHAESVSNRLGKSEFRESAGWIEIFRKTSDCA